MSILHVYIFEYVGSNNVSWNSVDEGFEYISNVVNTHGTSDEYTEFLNRQNSFNLLNPTDELITEHLLKLVIEFPDQATIDSTYIFDPGFDFDLIFEKGDIIFKELFINSW